MRTRRSTHSSQAPGRTTNETATTAAVAPRAMPELAPLAANDEPQQADAGRHLGQDHERPCRRPAEADDHRAGQQQRDVAARQLHDREQDAEGEQARSGQEADGHQQDRRPDTHEHDPGQGGERCDELQERRRVDVRAGFASSRTGRTGRGGGSPSSEKASCPVPHGRPNGWAEQHDHQPHGERHEQADHLGGWQARCDAGRDGRAVARDGQLGGQVSHVHVGSVASREGWGAVRGAVGQQVIVGVTVRHHGPNGLPSA